MAHPVINTARTRQMVIAGLAGTVLLCAAPATAMTIVGDDVSETCHALSDVVDPACDVVEDTAGAVQDQAEPALAPVTEPVQEVVETVEPVVESLPTDALPSESVPPPGEDAPAVPPPPGTPADDAQPPRPGGSTQPGSSTGTAEGEEEVEAAGKTPEEIMEPQAPAAEGRIAGGPTLQPSDLGALGSNIAGIGSDSGLTLQPYDSPMVSVPTAMEMDMPQVAGAPVTTASPVAAIAAEAMALTGDVVLPQTGAEAAMVTATGIGLLVGSAYVMRRRVGMLSLSRLDERILDRR